MAKKKRNIRNEISARNVLGEFGAPGADVSRFVGRKANLVKARIAKRQKLIRRKATIPPKKPKPIISKGRTVKVGISIGGATQIVSRPQSVRGDFEAGTEALVASIIIHFILYEPETQRLYIQLTAAGEWRDYTYLNVPIRAFEAFRDAPSKGRHFNRHIKNTKIHGFHYNFVRGKAF